MSDYCAETVFRHDRDRYRLAMSQPPRHRPALLALFAFNHEIAKTREVVSDPTLGLIRLQWWRESIDRLYAGGIPAHEVLGALAPHVAALPKEDFIALIDAREADLDNFALPSLHALEDYADRTATPLNRLALRISVQPERGLRPVSIAYALTGLLRSQPVLRDRDFLPHGVSADDMARRARRHLDEAAGARGFLRASAALAGVYLGRMASLEYRLSDPALNLPPVSFSLAAFAGRFRSII